MNELNHCIYEFGPFRLDAQKRVLLRDREPVKLFPKEFDTLLALVERSGQVLDKDELMRRFGGRRSSRRATSRRTSRTCASCSARATRSTLTS